MEPTITARCHCGQLSASLQVTASSLPLSLHLCACRTCRAVSGYLATSYIAVPKMDASNPSQLRVTGTAQRYATSQDLDRCFCGTCGTSVYVDSEDPNRKSLCSGAFVRQPVGDTNSEPVSLLKYVGISHVDDTEDGGLARWIPQPLNSDTQGEAKIDRPHDTAGELDLLSTSSSDQRTYDKLSCGCHCSSVRFSITRPSRSTFEHDWPFQTRPSQDHEHKYVGLVCACDSCRTASGYHFAPWVYVPRGQIQDVMTGAQFNFEAAAQRDDCALNAYRSSEGVSRYFCGRCGAKIFYVADSQKRQMDVAAGVMQSQAGARVEDWVEWKGHVAEADDAPEDELVQRAAHGIADWARSTREARPCVANQL
jgi:hypothetical protein